MTLTPAERDADGPQECIFCRRARGEDFWVELVGTPHTIAALANHQRTPGSVIVIPRRHVVALHRLTPDESRDFHQVVRRICAAVRTAFDPDALYLWQGGRIPLPHIHARVSPRSADQPYSFVSNDQLQLTDMDDRLAIADRIRAEL